MTEEQFYGHHHMEAYLEKEIFKGYKNGTFIDVGAHDGVTGNNTLFFEKFRGWRGINFEPLPHVYQKLVANREKCVNLNVAVSDKDGEAEFFCNKGYTETLSGLKSAYDNRHLNRMFNEIIVMGGGTEVIKVKTRTLASVISDFKELLNDRVNYLSVDVEGAEFEVIKSIDFDKVFIDVIVFENNYNDKSVPIIEYLNNKGYILLNVSQDVYMIHKDSEFRG